MNPELIKETLFDVLAEKLTINEAAEKLDLPVIELEEKFDSLKNPHWAQYKCWGSI